MYNTLDDSHTTNHSILNLVSVLSLVFTTRFLAKDLSQSHRNLKYCCNYSTCAVFTTLRLSLLSGRAIAQVVSRWLPTAAVRGSKPDLGMWDLWWDKLALGRFSPCTSVSPAIVVRSTNYSTITLIYHPGKMYNRPMCGRSTGAYTNLGDLQRDLMGVKSHPTK
jgi:hypothetical protein